MTKRVEEVIRIDCDFCHDTSLEGYYNWRDMYWCYGCWEDLRGFIKKNED